MLGRGRAQRSALREGEILEHFREALRLDPTLEYARLGMIEALKARYWLYRQVLGYFLWLGRLSVQVRWGLMIGLLVLQRVVATIARDNPGLQPVLDPLLIAYIAFVLTTWTAVPLSNLFLRLNRFGRHALSPAQRQASNWVGVFVVLALAGVGWALVDATYGFLGWPIALGFILLLIPISGTCACESGWPRRVMLLYTVAMVGVMALAVALIGVGVHYDGRDNATAVACVRIALALLQGNVWATLGACLLANWLANVRPRL